MYCSSNLPENYRLNMKHKLLHIFFNFFFAQYLALSEGNFFSNSSKVCSVIPYINGQLELPGIPFINIWDNLTPINTTTRSLAPTKGQPKYYAHFTGVVYCKDQLLTDWTCCECRNLPNVSLVTELNNNTCDTRAIVTINNVRKEIVVTWRGTETVKNIVTDFSFLLVPAQSDQTLGIKLHVGAWKALDSLYARVLSTLTKLLTANPLFRLVIIGHSLGGQLAALNYFRLKTDAQFPNTTYSLITYGAPRVGNLQLANWFNNQTDVIGRVTGNEDLIPHVIPAFLGYVHFNTELWFQGVGKKGTTKFCNRDFIEDPNCSNSNGPLYNLLDHSSYFGTKYANCIFENAFGVHKDIYKRVIKLACGRGFLVGDILCALPK